MCGKEYIFKDGDIAFFKFNKPTQKKKWLIIIKSIDSPIFLEEYLTPPQLSYPLFYEFNKKS